MNLTKEAQQVIDAYLALSIGDKKITCPYFNNKKSGVRAGLRVMIGKGSPEDIVEEITLLALRKKIDLKKLDTTQLRNFLIENNVGIECSGFVFHVLNAEIHAKKNTSLGHILSFKKSKNPLRFLLQKLRPAENTSVQVLADKQNSHEISLDKIRPGDMIIMIGFKKSIGARDHVLLVTEVEENPPTQSSAGQRKITYTHSLHWDRDTALEHGIKQGQITITNKTNNLITQTWVESGKKDEANETWQRASKSTYCAIRRLNCLDETHTLK